MPSLHRYTYAANRPTFYVDPTGHFLDPAKQQALQQGVQQAPVAAPAVATGLVALKTVLGGAATAVVGTVAAAGVAVAGGVLAYEYWQHSKLKEEERLAGELHREVQARQRQRQEAFNNSGMGLIILEGEDVSERLYEERRRAEARAAGVELGAARSLPGSDERPAKRYERAVPPAKDVGIATGEEDPTAGQIPDPVVIESKGARVAKPGTVVGSAQTSRSIRTSIRAAQGEDISYKEALLRGEIGLRAPGHSNAPGADLITAIQDPTTGQWEIVVTDTKTSTTGQFPTPRKKLPAKWRAEAMAAVSPGQLDLGDPLLEAEIQAAARAGRIVPRQLEVDLSDQGQGQVSGW